ncbi:MAG: hypothetical protein M1836_002869 [Candelina mexicana]|nr:MAG: hypothetical protein M1836_002869 [Candelina mexicana]
MDPSSKVTVEYFDPSNVFSLLSSELLSRLPLRNLHWKSPTRPLRSIDSLHVDLVPNDAEEQQQAIPSALSRVKSADSDGGSDGSNSRPQSRGPPAVEQKTVPEAGRGTFKGPLKERRHQIPGLRQTPYLKVYLLRCDDNETYKASARKQLREWIRLHTPPSQSSSSVNTQENHDAFEYLIVHVVLPDTVAATQPRVSRSSGGGTGSGTERTSSKSKWPGRSSTAIFDKLCADFNSTSKYATDRVAQIRLEKGPEAAQPATSAPLSESVQEHDKAWQDLISKFKSLILTSFDLRVSQYEHDIREKDSQRNLPGWNFCTFFVLKEGLARGFESVGLVEDALVGYDELAVGLDSTIREQASMGGGEGRGGAFLAYTEDLRREAEYARQVAKGGSVATEVQDGKADEAPEHDEQTLQEFPEAPELRGRPLDANKKRYRDLILSSNISIYDFRCYLFSRQMSLLLRLGNALSAQSELLSKLQTHPASNQSAYSSHHPSLRKVSPRATDRPEDLTSLAELCRRALEFTASVARIMRQDLVKAFAYSDRESLTSGDVEGVGQVKAPKDTVTAQIVDNVVSSWKFSVVQQILEQTASKSLPMSQQLESEAKASTEKTVTFGDLRQEPKVAIGEPKTMMHPARTSSLPSLSQEMPDVAPRSTLGQANGDENRRNSEYNVPPRGATQTPVIKTGLQDLAAYRAELYLTARAALEALGGFRGWVIGFGAVTGKYFQKPWEEVILADPENLASSVSPPMLFSEGISSAPLKAALTSKEAFCKLYEVLTEAAHKHYNVGQRFNSLERIMADLAALKFYTGDFPTAATYFHRIAPFYAETSWHLVETSMLKMYAQCLKQLNQKEGFIRATLKLLSKAASTEQARLLPRRAKGALTQKEGPDDQRNEKIETSGYVEDLLSYSKRLSQKITTPLTDYCTDVHVDHHIRHYSDKDGFQLLLGLRYLLEGSMTLQSIKLSIIGSFGVQSRDIWLQSDGQVVLKRGMNRIWLGSNCTVSGSFIVDKILLEAHNLVFIHETLSRAGDTTPATFPGSFSATAVTIAKGSRVTCYPRPNALNAKLTLSRVINLEHVRSIEVEVSTGWNNVSNGEIRIRSGSAGLRLRTGESQPVKDSVTIRDKSRVGVIAFGELSAGSIAKFKIPYGLEHDSSELSVKLEVAYTTKTGDFLFAANPTISIVLPLGVNVQDIFKDEAQFSSFSISAATHTPIYVLSSRLEGSDIYEATGGVMGSSSPMLIFPKQPASLIYRVTRREMRSQNAQGNDKKRTALALTIDYRCLDEDITDTISTVFTQSINTIPAVEEYSRLLMPTLLSTLNKRLTVAELETVGLLGEVQISSFEEMPWSEALEGVPPNARSSVKQWLMGWHKANPTISVMDNSISSDIKPPRQIIIPVELPHLQVVHTVDLHLLDLPSGSLVAVGQMLAAELRIHHTRSWDTSSYHADTSLEFSYEIHANPEIWLIGGRRRAHFTAKENKLHTFPIMLLPLRAGHLLLPTVEIKPSVPRPQTLANPPTTSSSSTRDPNGPAGVSAARHAAQNRIGASSPDRSLNRPSSTPAPDPTPGHRQHISTSGEGSESMPVVTCETDYKNQAETVLVIADVKSTTVSLDPGGLGGAWVLESERRG